MERPIAVMADTHGHYETVAPAVETELAAGRHIVFAGDFVDGPDTARLIRLIRSIGDRATAITGNHEWVLRNTLTDMDQLRSTWRDHIWPSYERGVLESYRLPRTGNRRHDSEQLAETMQRTGQLAWLNSLPAYTETNDSIVVHAGPNPGELWRVQSQALDIFCQYPVRMQQEPDQIFSHQNSLMATVAEEVDSRTFITGHAHLSIPIEERINKRRIRLATWLAKGADLLVWRSDERRIVEYANQDY